MKQAGEENESDFSPLFQGDHPSHPKKNPEKSGHIPAYQARKLRHRQGWADYFMEKVDTFQDSVPKQYNNWVSALVAATYFGDSIAQLKLREELDRLAQKEVKYVPSSKKERLQVAHCQLLGLGTAQDPEKAVTSYGALVEESQLPQAQFALGMCYMDGIVVKENTQIALDYLKKAKDQGHTLARYQYALSLFMGKGEQRDLKFCFQEFLEMANEGCAFACTIVGIFYQYGITVDRDSRMAEGYIKHGEQAGFSVDRFGDDLYEVVEDLILDYMDEFPEAEL